MIIRRHKVKGKYILDELLHTRNLTCKIKLFKEKDLTIFNAFAENQTFVHSLPDFQIVSRAISKSVHT